MFAATCTGSEGLASTCVEFSGPTQSGGTQSSGARLLSDTVKAAFLKGYVPRSQRRLSGFLMCVFPVKERKSGCRVKAITKQFMHIPETSTSEF